MLSNAAVYSSRSMSESDFHAALISTVSGTSAGHLLVSTTEASIGLADFARNLDADDGEICDIDGPWANLSESFESVQRTYEGLNQDDELRWRELDLIWHRKSPIYVAESSLSTWV